LPIQHHSYGKEVGLYQKEVEDLHKKLDSLVADKAEEWYIKNAVCLQHCCSIL
jgi:hypothetical protein